MTCSHDFAISVCFDRENKGENSTNSSDSSKKIDKKKMKEILQTFCAIFNSGHCGKVTLVFECGSQSDVRNLARSIEQRLSNVLGFYEMQEVLNLERHSPSNSLESGEMVFIIESVNHLCTLNYNIYIPTETQVLPLSRKTPIAEIKELLSVESRPTEGKELVQIGTHHKKFVLKRRVQLLSETKTVQFKCLKADKSKCVSLGDRMTNNENKFCRYVSAFGNHLGGHIYFGLDDDGVVQGEFVEDQNKIVAVVQNAVKKMVWPVGHEEPRRGEEWDIFFEEIKNFLGCPVESTFVIVVWVAYCPGGVFTQEPESYTVVENQVVRMEFQEWKRRIFQTSLPSRVSRVQWSSEEVKNTIYNIMEKLGPARNGGNRYNFARSTQQIEKKFCFSAEAQIAILFQEAAFACRRTEMSSAERSIIQYDSLCSEKKPTDTLFFECFGLYLKSAKERSGGNYDKSLDLASSGLQTLQSIAPGLCSAWFYLHVASLLTIRACSAKTSLEERDYLMERAKSYDLTALEHCQQLPSFPGCVADAQQNIFIHLATLYLACAMNGTVDFREDVFVSAENLSLAKACFDRVNNLILEGHPLSCLRQIQHLLARSCLSLRQSQLSGETVQSRRAFLAQSRRYSMDARKLAMEGNFQEMVCNCDKQLTCVEEEKDRLDRCNENALKSLCRTRCIVSRYSSSNG